MLHCCGAQGVEQQGEWLRGWVEGDEAVEVGAASRKRAERWERLFVVVVVGWRGCWALVLPGDEADVRVVREAMRER